jgi:hypothetical protein
MDETCCAYLYAKIDMHARSKYADLGFLTREEIRKGILNGNFTEAETIKAINFCIKRDKIDLYYEVKCPECDEKTHILERQYPEGKTFNRLTRDGLECDYCKNNMNIKDETSVKVNRKYCISPKELSSE